MNDAQAALAALRPRRSKYGSRKVELDGYTFDSAREAEVYRDLKLAQAAGEISGLEVHPRVVLQRAGRDFAGQRIAPITYTPDFAYRDRSGKYWRVEVKSRRFSGRGGRSSGRSTRTEAYSIRKRMLLYQDPYSCFKEVE